MESMESTVDGKEKDSHLTLLSDGPNFRTTGFKFILF
jgi:hypothetical protein